MSFMADEQEDDSSYTLLVELLIKERDEALADLKDMHGTLEDALFENTTLSVALLDEHDQHSLTQASLSAEQGERRIERNHADFKLASAQGQASRMSRQLQSANFIMAKQEAEIARLTALYESAMVELIAAPR